MRFEWNVEKDRINQPKHGLSFDTALLVFDDPRALCALDRVIASSMEKNAGTSSVWLGAP